METHRRTLGILNLVWGGLGAVSGISLLLLFGGVASILSRFAVQEPDARLAVSIIGFAGTFLFFILLLLSIPSLIAGYGLVAERSWCVTLGIVVSALHLLNIPFGTMLGIYGLWVLLPRSGGSTPPSLPPS